MTDAKVLAYNPAIVPQQYSWDCGPASTQVVLDSLGIEVTEDELISEIGTTQDGTAYVGLIERVLDQRVPSAQYAAVYLNDPPSQTEIDKLWADVTNSIDAGYGCVFNFDSPPDNHPVAVDGSVSPNYGPGTIFHYVPCMGYNPDDKTFWIPDPGFGDSYWMTAEQAATIIAPKGYCYAAVAAAKQMNPPAAPAAPVASVDTLFADVSEFQCVVNDSYPYRVLSIRSNDGTYEDKNFAANYAWATAAVDAGKLDMLIVYAYWRPNWQDTVNTHMSMVKAAGGPHPKMVSMMDVESGGNPVQDWSDALNATDAALVSWLGDSRRVIAYGNTNDLGTLWPSMSGEKLVIASYGSNPDYPGKVAHQYTDGTGFGGGLPEGCPPFGNCDMNSADGLTSSAFAALCGVGVPAPVVAAVPVAESVPAAIAPVVPVAPEVVVSGLVSESPFRPLGDTSTDDESGFVVTAEAAVHALYVIRLAEYGVPGAVALLRSVAGADLVRFPDRVADAELAQRVLAKLGV